MAEHSSRWIRFTRTKKKKNNERNKRANIIPHGLERTTERKRKKKTPQNNISTLEKKTTTTNAKRLGWSCHLSTCSFFSNTFRKHCVFNFPFFQEQQHRSVDQSWVTFIRARLRFICPVIDDIPIYILTAL